MDTSEYMPMFLAEALEHIQELNLAVVRLEEDPSDYATVEEIFRIAHSMKGMSATMGFAEMARLTHEMEDVFEILRQRREALNRGAVDTLLACLDALSACLESIESDGIESLEATALIERLHALARPRTAEQELNRIGGRVDPNLEAALAAGERVLRVVICLDSEVLMPAVRAHMVLAALGEHGDVIGSVPAPELVEQFDDDRIEAWLISEHDQEVIQAKLSQISDVASVELFELSDEAAAEPAADHAAQAPAADPTADAPAADPEPAPPAADPEPAAPTAAVHHVAARPTSSSTRTVRVDAERLDALMHAMGELVIHRTAVEALIGSSEIPGLHHAMQELTRSSQALQGMVMQVRMIPVDVVFLRFPRLVRDLSGKLGKDVTLDLVGAETELDRTVVDALGDPLVHLVRNSLDHGLEGAEERRAAGKPEQGTLRIAARHAGGSVVIEVSDDGRGVDPAAVARKALASGMIDAQAAQEMDMRGALELLFAPGFSTSATTSDISGRGVGMDAVRTKIRELGGEVVIDSTAGAGTCAQIRLPLTLAIVSSLLVVVGGEPYAIPLERIERTLRLVEQHVESVAGEQLLVLEDGVLPLLDAAAVFGRRAEEHQFAVVVRTADRRVALAVDELTGQRELVTRPLPKTLDGGEPVSGGASLADGRLALIVDCDRVGDGGPPLLASRGAVAPLADLSPAVRP